MSIFLLAVVVWYEQYVRSRRSLLGFRLKQALVAIDLWKVSVHPHLLFNPATQKKKGDPTTDTTDYH